MSIDSNLAIVCLTKNGKNLACKIHQEYKNSHIYVVSKNKELPLVDNSNYITTVSCSLKDLTEKLFVEYKSILFIMATGIVVRVIAPLIESKLSDPAILVSDEKGLNIISLLSGHVGGANELTLQLSEIIKANPVITTATDVNNKSSLDVIAKKLDAYICDFKKNVKEINSMLVNNQKVGIYIDGEHEVDTRGFYEIDDISKIDKYEKVVVVTNKMGFENDQFIKVIPRNIVLGIGCRRNTDSKILKESVIDFLKNNELDINCVKEIGSIDIKHDEQAIIHLAKDLNVDFKVISSSEISQIEDLFEKSQFVKKQVGVYNVSEPVAYILSKGNVIVGKTKYNGITISMGRI